ncbi:aminotransferase class III-fold pyridoxal phosphate-dependent enzyme, partial [Paenibacillus polymyxa]|nr:aminotransferase class III-fold pyridoxal phosphate-dependent enzyme [Paenibacillus polymyxa]
FETEPRLAQAQAISAALSAGLEPCRELPWVRDVRALGAIGVVELDGIADREALKRRLVEAGVWVRPFGNVVYLTPALTIDAEDLARLT